MGHMHFDSSFHKFSNIKLKVARTNSLYTVLHVCAKREEKKKMK